MELGIGATWGPLVIHDNEIDANGKAPFLEVLK